MKIKEILFRPKAWCFAVLVLFLWAGSPIDFLQELQRNYDQYQEKFPSVKINLLFNQPVYAPGDTAFLAAWYMSEELTTLKGDQLINLDLLAGNGSTAQRMRFKVKNGKGFNQLVLRKDLAPGIYRFVAYTDWMRNFGEAWFYQKSIQIISKKELIPGKTAAEIKFFPEGGHLVEGLTSRVAILGPPSVELTIHDGSVTEPIKVLLDSTGVGSFIMTPRAGQSYKTEWPTAGKTWSLPTPEKDGVAVQLVSGERCELLLSLPPGSSWSKKEIYAVVTTRGKILIKQRITVPEGQPYPLQIPPHAASSGLHQLTVFGGDGNILAQRVFVPSIKKDIQVKMQFPAEVKQRENISGSVEIMDAMGNTIESDVNIAVIQRKLFKGSTPINYFNLSDLPAVSERAERFGALHETSLNDFLISQKWQRTNWDVIVKGEMPAVNYPFQSQLKLKGQVISLTKGTPPPDSTVIISYLQKNSAGFEAYTHNGQFEIPFLFDFWGNDKVFCTLQYRSKNIDNNYSIIIPKDTLTWTSTWTSIEDVMPSSYGEYALSKELVSKSYSFFGGNQQNGAANDKGPNNTIEEEFSGVDYSVNVADYVVFPKMEDLLREIVPFAQFRRRGSEESVRISFRYETSTRTYKDDPLYVIDGTMSKNTSLFVNLKPENLVTIKVINNPNKLAQLSRLGENGVIFVETKKRDFFNPLFNHNLFPVVGLSRPVPSYNATYSGTTNTRRIPDLRSTLYWKPMLETDKTGLAPVSFYASDDVGTMKILVQGITKDGRPFLAERDVTVTFNATPK